MAKILLNVELNSAQASKGLNEIKKSIESVSTSLKSVSVNKDLTAQINALTKYYDTLAKAAEKVTANTSKRQLEEEKLATQTQKTLTQEAKRVEILERVRRANERTIATQQKSIKSVDSLRMSYANLMKQIQSAENKYPRGTFDKLRTSIEGASTELKTLKDTDADYNQKRQEYTASLEVYRREFSELTAETERNTTAVIKNGDSIMSMAKKFVIWQAAATVVMKPLNLIRNALASIDDTLVKVENTVIGLQRILPNGSASDKGISNALFGLAQQYGQSFENVSDIATNFARTGMSWSDTLKATASALLALNVAELDATQASDGLIAIMQQFGYEAKDLTTIIDSLNKTADNYAVTTDKLLTALQRTGSSAANANLSLEETVGLITALSEATGRSGENLGTAVNSLIQYSSKSSALDVFAQLSDDTNGVVSKYKKGIGNILDVWKAVSKEIQNLDERQESLLKGLVESDEIKELNEELAEELGDIFDEKSGVYGTANTFRKNYFIALLGNMDTVAKATKTAQDSQGYSVKENQKYLETYTAKLNTLKAKWEEIANDEQGILGIKKGLVDIGLFLLDIQDKLGGLKPVIMSLIGITTAWVLIFKTDKVVEFFSVLKKGFDNLKYAIPNAVKAWKAYAGSLNAAGTATVSFSTAMQASIPVIGLIIAAVSLLTMGINKLIESQKEAREEEKRLAQERLDSAVATWEANKKTAQSLQSLYNSYQNLSPENDDFYSTESKIVDLLGDKVILLGKLTKGTGDYTNKVKELAEAELESLKQEKLFTLNQVQTKLESPRLFSAEALSAFINGSKLIGQEGNLDFARDYFSSGSIEDLLRFVEQWKTLNKQLSDEQLKAKANGDDEAYRKFGTYFSLSSEGLNDVLPLIEKYKELTAEVDDITANIDGKIKDIEYTLNSLPDTLREKLVSQLEKARDLLRESTDWAEKLKSVEEARQSLYDARNQRTVSIFNSETGMWELQANAKDIKSAQENLDKALLDLETSAYERIIQGVNDSTATEESILALLLEITPLLGEGSDFENKIREIFSSSGIKIPTSVADSLSSNGIGGLLNPVSSSYYSEAYKTMGLLSGQSVTQPNANVVSNYGSNSNNDNRTYTINGVPISQDMARNYTLEEIFNNMSLVGNN